MAKKDDFAKVIRDIKNVGGNIAGVVYNKKPASGKKANETYYYASTSAKWEAKKKQEMEAQQKRQEQRSRATKMLEKDRKPENYVKNVIKEVENVKNKMNELNNANLQTNDMNLSNKSPEERASEMLKQFNDYLQKEKENRDNNNRS